MERATCVIVDGPNPTLDRYGDEVASWSVSVCDDDGEPVDPKAIRECYSRDSAINLAELIGESRGLDVEVL